VLFSKRHEPELSSIEVEIRPPRTPAFAAIVKLCGKHDLATSARIRETLAPIYGDVLVDLSDCTFLDSSVLNVFMLDSHERGHEGQHIEILVPAINVSVTRTLQVSGVTQLLTVHESTDLDSLAQRKATVRRE
jgi:anti-anti-sigma factor